MAKVSTIKCEVNGTPYTINVNCNSSGQFSANIPEFVASALRINSKLSANTLTELEAKFYAALKQYKEAETKEELLIAISYKSRGAYNKNKEGEKLFYDSRRGGYNLEVSFSKPDNALGFDFSVVIKETIDKKEEYYEARLGSSFSWMDEEEYSQPDKYHRWCKFYHVEEYKLIPFSETALQSLENAQEKIRSISEFLFNFIEQDEEQILLTLTNQKLLS